jgi:hypothetical protein
VATNGSFSASGYGTAEFYVNHIAYGVEAIFSDADARAERTVYFHNVVNDNFVISMVFNSWASYNAAANWFRGYMSQAADPENQGVSPMVVQVPSRNFIGIGIPETGISYGDHVPAITYPMTVSFTGASDYSQASEISYTPPQNSSIYDAGNPYFYPLGIQLASPYQSVDAQTYDSNVTPLPPTPAAPSTGGTNDIGRGVRKPN